MRIDFDEFVYNLLKYSAASAFIGLCGLIFYNVYIVFFGHSCDDTQPVIQETTIRIVEDTLSVDDSRVVSRTTIGKQSFLIFKLGHHYQVFEEKK